MSLVGFKAQNHPQQRVKDSVDDRAVTPEDFAEFSRRWGPFTLDVAAAKHNAKCERFFTMGDNGLSEGWGGERIWCNPPYSNLGAWLKKAWWEWGFGVQLRPTAITMLLPANRTEQGWWQEHVESRRDREGSPLRVTFLPGRLRFLLNGATAIKPNMRPPFGCCILDWRLR